MTTQHMTASHWGLYEVDNPMTDEIKIRPFRHDPAPSPIGLYMASPQLTKNRVRRPAVRRGWLDHGPGGQSGARGTDTFVEVDWDVALELASAEIQRVIQQHGNASIFGGSYGWGSAGRFHHAQSQVHRFLNTIGGYVRHVDSYSLGAARALVPYVVASMDQLMETHTDWDTLANHTQLFVTFGGVPTKNAQITAGGTAEHRVPAGLTKMRNAGTRFINISPVKSDLDIGERCEWWPIRPNTDTALILAIVHTLIAENRHDITFLKKYCVGFERFRAYLIGESDGQAKTAEWAERITGIAREKVVALARDLASHRSMINMAWSLQRAHHGEQPYWGLIALACMLGQIGLPGGGFGVGYGSENSMGSPHRKLKGPTLPQGENHVSEFIPVARIADMLLRPGEVFTYQGKALRYPDIRLIYWAGGNPFHHHQDLNRLLRAWQKPETVIVNEQFWTPLAKLADIVFPATTTLERNDIFHAKRESCVAAMKQAQTPFGEARSDYAIFSGLAQRLSVGDAFSEGLDEMGWLERLYCEWRREVSSIGINLPPFNTFWAENIIEIPQLREPVVMLESYRSDPVINRLDTPSGKIEIFSETIASYGYDDCPGYPCWIEPFEWLGADRAERFPLHLISDQPASKLHSQLDHGPHSSATKANGREPIWLHPIDAAARNIRDGDTVRVFNARGACLATAIITDNIRLHVVKLSTGAWFDPAVWSAGNYLEKHGNPNVLTADIPSSSFSQGCSAQTCLVDIEKFEGILPVVTAHNPPM